MKIIQENKKNINTINAALKNGAVLVLPTDTVYGLVCDASNEKAVEKIFNIKKRKKSKPLGIFVKDTKTAKRFAFIDKNQESFLKNSKITAIFKAKKETLSKLVYKDGTIGIRIPNYDLLNIILDKFKEPIAQTSANLSGKPATTKISDILEQFSIDDVVIINSDDLPESKPSRIIDLSDGEIKVVRY